MRGKARGRAFLAVLIAMTLGLGGCATMSQGDRDRVDGLITQAQQLADAVMWIAPIACRVVAMVEPGSMLTCETAVAGASVLKQLADEAIAAYRKDPSASNRAGLEGALKDLETAWGVLDKAYKGQAASKGEPSLRGEGISPSKGELGIVMQSRIPPSRLPIFRYRSMWRARA